MNKALEYALKLLAKKDYTEAEIKRKFALRQVEAEEAASAITFLKEKKFINDQQYAESYYKCHLSRGRIRLRFELKKRGIAEDIINMLFLNLDETTEIERAKEVAANWCRKNCMRHVDRYKMKQLLISKLSRQGFEYGVILQAVDCVDFSADPASDQEID